MSRFRFALLFLGVFIAGCVERERLTPTEPPADVPLAQETIGPAGGVLQTEAFRLTVPAGALETTHTLTLSIEQNESPLAPYGVSDLYRIDGLPLDIAGRLRIAIRPHDGKAAGAMLAIGEDAYAISKAGIELGWWMAEGADSSGWCVGGFPAAHGSKEVRPGAARQSPFVQNPAPVRVAVVRGPVSLTTAGGHFRITYPPTETTPADAESLGAYLERAYGIYTRMGFDASARTAWPVSVTALRQQAWEYGCSFSTVRGKNHCYLQFNTLHMNAPQVVRPIAGHEVFHFFQYFYDPRTELEKGTVNGPLLWLDEATATWVEVKMAADTAHVTVTRRGNEFAPLYGLQKGIAAFGAGPYGYGLSSLIKYLVRAQGEAFILATYQEILRTGRHPIAALEDQLDRPYSVCWHDYLGDLIRGGPYRDISAGAVWRFANFFRLDLRTVGTEESFQYEYMSDLSGLVVVLQPTAPQYPAGAALKLNCSGSQCDLSAFRIRAGADTTLTFLGESRDSLVVTDLQGIAAGGYKVMVLVDNSMSRPPTYDQVSDITLTAQVLDEPDIGHVIGATVDLQYEATWLGGAVVPRQGLLLQALSGSMTDGRFESSWDSTATNGVRYVGHINVTVRPQDLSLVSWSAESWWYFPAPGTYNRYRASGTAVPLGDQTEGIIRYWRLGEDACESISDIYVEQVSNGETRTKLLRFDCNSESNVFISLLRD